MSKEKYKNALMQMGLLLEAIALTGNESDMKLAIKDVCNLDDELVERYWSAAQKLVLSKNVVKLMKETGE